MAILLFIFWNVLIFNGCHGMRREACEEMDQLLMLTPLLDKNETEKARKLSLVDESFLEDFVPQSHAGFFTVDRTIGSHMFFWFFPSPTNSSAPLVLWLNGGPTISSMFGLLYENGPMELDETSTKDRPRYRKRQHSWVGPFSMLYIDNPVGAGFSYSEREDKGNRTMEEKVSQNLFSLLEQFLKVFPEYKNLEIYIGGQSYAGMFVISFAHYIHSKARKGMTDIDLTGIYLGGPFFDPEAQASMMSEFYYHMGLVSHKTHTEQMLLQKMFFSMYGFDNIANSKFSMKNVFSFIFPVRSYGNIATHEHQPYRLVNALMNTLTIKRAIHAGTNHTFFVANPKLWGKFLADFLSNRREKLAVILNNYKVLIFNGDLESLIPHAAIEASLLQTQWKLQREYKETSRIIWQIGRKRLGTYSQVGQFCRVVVSRAGHQTPHDQPETTLRVLQDFISHGCVRARGSEWTSVSNWKKAQATVNKLTSG